MNILKYKKLYPDDGRTIDGSNNENNETNDENLEEIEIEIDENELEDEKTEQEESVPLSKFLELKGQLKESKKKLTKLEEKELDSTLIQKKNEIIEKWISRGYDKVFAEGYAEDIISTMQSMTNTKKKEYFENSINDDIEELSKSDVFFDDAMAYKKDISSYISKMKKSGVEISVEEAYMKVRGVQNRLKELKTDIEQKNLYGKENKNNKTVSNSGSSTIKTNYKLDSDDKKALDMLKKMQPDSNWNEEKYFKSMKNK